MHAEQSGIETATTLHGMTGLRPKDTPVLTPSGAPGVSAPNEGTITLRDGRTLGFAQFGCRTGTPLFFFHGGGSSRLTRHPDDSIVEDLGVRLITIDRPGVGLSDPKPRRSLLDWPEDVCELADALGLGRFAVLGWSAGGPHALVCAYRIPHRLSSAGVISSLSPVHWPGAVEAVTDFANRFSPLKRYLTKTVHRGLTSLHSGSQPLSDEAPHFPLPTEISIQPSSQLPTEVRAIHRQRFMELVRAREWDRGIELAMLARPWRFHLEDIRMKVHIWHGTHDRTTRPYMAQYLARTIPQASLTIMPGEGHHVGFTHWREVVQTLTSAR
ncbi:MAG: alpha/beta hydrolase [Chloroflexota bacterium]